MQRTLFNRLLLVMIFSPFVAWCDEKSLSLDDAISQALQQNPELQSSLFELQAREARISQAGARVNPELGILSEDFGGSGAFEGFDSSQTTAQLSQRLELGGKRGARQKVATLNRDVAQSEFRQKRIEITARVRRTFFAVLAEQQRLQLMEQLLKVSKQFSAVVVERIQAGKIPPIDEVRSNAIVASAEVDVMRSKRELDSARYELAAAIGTIDVEFDSVQGKLSGNVPNLSYQELLDSLDQNPELIKSTIEIEETRASVEAEKSKSVPDLTIAGGYRILEASKDHAFVLGASIPLPLFDRNKGGIQEAEKRVGKAQQMRSSRELELRTLLSRAYQIYSAAKTETETLQNRVLPATQTSFDAISDGYKLGKYGYLDVLEAQRSLFQSQIQLLRVLTELNTAAVELERITGIQIVLPIYSEEHSE